MSPSLYVQGTHSRTRTHTHPHTRTLVEALARAGTSGDLCTCCRTGVLVGSVNKAEGNGLFYIFLKKKVGKNAVLNAGTTKSIIIKSTMHEPREA